MNQSEHIIWGQELSIDVEANRVIADLMKEMGYRPDQRLWNQWKDNVGKVFDWMLEPANGNVEYSCQRWCCLLFKGIHHIPERHQLQILNLCGCCDAAIRKAAFGKDIEVLS